METDSSRPGPASKVFPPQNKKQLSALLGVSIYVLNKWLEDIAEELGPHSGKVFSSRQVSIIVRNYGCIETAGNEKKSKK